MKPKYKLKPRVKKPTTAKPVAVANKSAASKLKKIVAKARKTNARRRPIEVVKKAISENPHLEHAFVKRARCQIKDVTKNNTKYSTLHDIEKTVNYMEKTESKGGPVYKIHTHSKKGPASMLPSIFDLTSASLQNVIYINEGKRISEQVHFHVRSKFKKSFENYQNKVDNIRTQLSKIFQKEKMTPNQQRKVTSTILGMNLVNELLGRTEGIKYLQNKKPILNNTRFNSELTDFCLKNRLFNQVEIINYLKYQHLFDDNKSKLQMYELLGLQFKFVANKYNGYRFDPKTIDFKRTI